MRSMKPYAGGKNRRLTRWRRANILGKAAIYLAPFLEDLGALWALHLPMPTSAKAITTVLLGVLMTLPLLYPPLILAVSIAAVEIIIFSRPQPWFMIYGTQLAQYTPAPKESTLVLRTIEDLWVWLSSFCTSCDYLRIFQDITDNTP